MKISVVTVCRNAEASIADTLLSVQLQSHPFVEHIIIDGASSDRTLEIVQGFPNENLTVISEEDEGIYDAMNKGARLASGEVVCFLNADDYFSGPNVLAEVARQFQDQALDCLFGDMVVIKENGETKKVVRLYRAPSFPGLGLRWGHMPPHPAAFVRRDCLAKAGYFDTTYDITADYELLVRLLCLQKLPCGRMKKIVTVMRAGGVSSSGFSSTLKINQEILRSVRSNGLMIFPIMIWAKYLFKWLQLVSKPKLPLSPDEWPNKKAE